MPPKRGQVSPDRLYGKAEALLVQLADRAGDLSELFADPDYGPACEETFDELVQKKRVSYGPKHRAEGLYFDRLSAASVGYRFGVLMGQHLGRAKGGAS